MDIIARLEEIAEHLNAAEQLANEIEEIFGVSICQLNRNVVFVRGIELIEEAANKVAKIDIGSFTNGDPYYSKKIKIGSNEVVQLADFDETGNPVFATAEHKEEI